MEGEDLFAREAQFHPSCRKSFNLKYANYNYLRDTARATNCDKTDTYQDHKVSAHLKAFTAVLDYIQDCITEQQKVVLLASLRVLYIQELEKNGFPNPEYRSEKLKARHLYRSKQLTTILSRLGLCETYDFGLELETALAKAPDEVSTSLTPQVITGEGNKVFHFEWDNMNKITTNIPGSNVVNSTGGIMIQEVIP